MKQISKTLLFLCTITIITYCTSYHYSVHTKKNSMIYDVSYDYYRNDSLFKTNVENICLFYIIDTVVIYKPYIISTLKEEFITDSITAQSIDIEDYNHLISNPQIYRLRYDRHMNIPLNKQKLFPFSEEQQKSFIDIPDEIVKEIKNEYGKSISLKLFVDSLRFFVGMENYFFKRNEHFHTLDKCSHKRGHCPYEFDTGTSLDMYVKVVTPIDYLNVLTLWSRLMNHKELIDIFIKDGFGVGFEKYTVDNEDNPIGRRAFLQRYDANLLKYSNLSTSFYDSVRTSLSEL